MQGSNLLQLVKMSFCKRQTRKWTVLGLAVLSWDSRALPEGQKGHQKLLVPA